MAITLDGSKGLVLPSWTTAGRPNNPEAGQMGYNTTLGYVEWYSSTYSTWYPIYQSFSYTIEYLVVAGGGGGGRFFGGGGGSNPDNTAQWSGKNGGSGVVIIRYQGSQRASGGTVTTWGGYTIHTFTSSGTYTA